MNNVKLLSHHYDYKNDIITKYLPINVGTEQPIDNSNNGIFYDITPFSSSDSGIISLGTIYRYIEILNNSNKLMSYVTYNNQTDIAYNSSTKKFDNTSRIFLGIENGDKFVVYYDDDNTHNINGNSYNVISNDDDTFSLDIDINIPDGVYKLYKIVNETEELFKESCFNITSSSIIDMKYEIDILLENQQNEVLSFDAILIYGSQALDTSFSQGENLNYTLNDNVFMIDGQPGISFNEKMIGGMTPINILKIDTDSTLPFNNAYNFHFLMDIIGEDETFNEVAVSHYSSENYQNIINYTNSVSIQGFSDIWKYLIDSEIKHQYVEDDNFSVRSPFTNTVLKLYNSGNMDKYVTISSGDSVFFDSRSSIDSIIKYERDSLHCVTEVEFGASTSICKPPKVVFNNNIDVIDTLTIKATKLDSGVSFKKDIDKLTISHDGNKKASISEYGFDVLDNLRIKHGESTSYTNISGVDGGPLGNHIEINTSVDIPNHTLNAGILKSSTGDITNANINIAKITNKIELSDGNAISYIKMQSSVTSGSLSQLYTPGNFNVGATMVASNIITDGLASIENADIKTLATINEADITTTNIFDGIYIKDDADSDPHAIIKWKPSNQGASVSSSVHINSALLVDDYIYSNEFYVFDSIHIRNGIDATSDQTTKMWTHINFGDDDETVLEFDSPLLTNKLHLYSNSTNTSIVLRDANIGISAGVYFGNNIITDNDIICKVMKVKDRLQIWDDATSSNNADIVVDIKDTYPSFMVEAPLISSIGSMTTDEHIAFAVNHTTTYVTYAMLLQVLSL